MVAILDAINGFLWGLPLLVLMIGTGLYFTIRSGAFQFRHFGWIMKNTVGNMFGKNEAKEKKEGTLSPWEAVCTAVGGTVGFGNIAGVATAVASGGPGAIFWMWAASSLGLILKQVEVTLGVYYRVTNELGEKHGGPTYYMQRGLGEERHWGAVWKILAVIFGIGIFSTYFVTSSNLTASEVVANAFHIPDLTLGGMVIEGEIIVGAAMCIFTYIITAGGTVGIAKIFSTLVPIMSIVYIVMGLIMIAMNITQVPTAFATIFTEAFTGSAAVGGFAGATVSGMIRTGMARSVYSNEAGWGTSPMIHGSADAKHPVAQGLWGSFEVFVDTFLVCSVSALAVVISGAYTSGSTGGALAMEAFQVGFGAFGGYLLAIIMVIFTVTTSGGWFTYYMAVFKHLDTTGKNKVVNALIRVFYWFRALPGLLWTIYLVKTANTGFIWTVVDITSAIPTFVNVFVVLILSGQYFKLLKDYKARYMGIGTVDPSVKLFYEDK